MVYFVVLILVKQSYSDWHRSPGIPIQKVLERITGIALDDLKIIEYDKSPRSFAGDYSAELILEMGSAPSEILFPFVDILIANGSDYWNCYEDRYTF